MTPKFKPNTTPLACRWVAENISYDYETKRRTGKHGSMDPESILNSRSSVCSGYARLLVSMLTEAGLRALKVSGSAGGESRRERSKSSDSSSGHAWVAVQIQGLTADPGVIEPSNAPLNSAASRTVFRKAGWCLIDPCWMAGYSDSKARVKEFIKKFDDVYFLTRPELFVLDHLPDDSTWQLLPPAHIMSPANFPQCQGRARDSWRGITHPFSSISLSASEFRKQALKVRLEICQNLKASDFEMQCSLYKAVAGPSSSYSIGELLISTDGFDTSTQAVIQDPKSSSSVFKLDCVHITGTPAELVLTVTSRGGIDARPGTVLILKAKLKVISSVTITKTGHRTRRRTSYSSSLQATYSIHVT